MLNHINTWMIEKNSMKCHYLTKRDIYSNISMEDITDTYITRTKKEFEKI